MRDSKRLKLNMDLATNANLANAYLLVVGYDPASLGAPGYAMRAQKISSMAVDLVAHYRTHGKLESVEGISELRIDTVVILENIIAQGIEYAKRTLDSQAQFPSHPNFSLQERVGRRTRE